MFAERQRECRNATLSKWFFLCYDEFSPSKPVILADGMSRLLSSLRFAQGCGSLKGKLREGSAQ